MAASSSARACTPPPPITRTPTAPRLGPWDDGWPTSSRKSSRIASRNHSHDMPSSPRKRAVAPDQVHRASGITDKEPIDNIPNSRLARSQLLAAQSGMLPTPVKTPSQQNDKKSVNISNVARTLFPDEQLMPSPKKQSYGALDSFVEDDEFPIHVDSKERVPERDQSSDNPFDDAYVVAATKKKRMVRKVLIPGEGVVPMEKAVGRDDGTLMSFRGRTQFLKHAPVDENNDSSFRLPAKSISRRLFAPAPKVEEKTAAEIAEEEAETDVEDNTDGGKAEEEAVTDVEYNTDGGKAEEEAETDVEGKTDGDKAEEEVILKCEIRIEVGSVGEQVPATPRAHKKKGMPMTPDAPRFGLDTPPDTRRITRSTTKTLDKTPATSPSGHSSRPGPAFTKFRVTKAKKDKDPLSDTKPSTRKRAADQLPAPPATKRART